MMLMLVVSFSSVRVILIHAFFFHAITECGIENGSRRIVNGTRVQDGRYPWIVYVQTQLAADKAAACTGSIINDRFIMTAGHCVCPGGAEEQIPAAVSAFRGPSCLSQLAATRPIAIRRIFKHPDYADRADSTNDIALLELWEPLKFTDSFRPICLPDYDAYDNYLAAGYGKTNFGFLLIASKCLKEAELEERDSEVCKDTSPTFDETKSICVGGGRNAACSGDSGGALMTRRDGRVYAAGIASTASLDCGAITSLPNVYERVTRHLPWIQTITSRAQANWCKAPHQAVS